MRAGFRGFTKLELLVVILITTLLAAFALYALQTYLVRRQIRDALESVRPIQAQIAQRYAEDGRMPADRVSAGLSPDPADTPGKFVAQLLVRQGRIDIFFGRKVQERIAMDRISLTPYLTDPAEIVWRCGDGPPPQGGSPIVPEREAAAWLQFDLSTIPSRYVPESCRPQQ